MKTNALIIFTRNPELGKVKTRLAKTIGDVKALEVYKDLLQHTMEQTQNIDCDKFVFYDIAIVEGDIWKKGVYHKKIQSKGDLGEKMQAAFEQLFEQGYTNCIIVGSDLFELKSEIIETAFTELERNEVILGPAEDGGYYLLGLKKMIPSLFKNKDWGSSTVLRDTLKDLTNHKINFLETLNDIDTFEDLEKSNYQFKQN
ncbi:TIGR04282 family arsenosugar biosynthesis glycosyltransferase [Flavobacterium sp. K5-23]|uniref:TIGR04282 family arsenosugar biosynthesis glycosyltransferase n=1 Tax=Flavobacterium sp. K5-23 TaxID=2746225 RepID=UPI00200F55D5|nr:TIGR04282 family arsenosugar biosynthesis glycosyltransferase [Flavobacterium sp. K5-23]UQD57339.1 TIGR04282 family arsenosugar biosynthesis glycosyltransferase [Flavobacterium sp. K5-23]